jgi:hypothetical protein
MEKEQSDIEGITTGWSPVYMVTQTWNIVLHGFPTVDSNQILVSDARIE